MNVTIDRTVITIHGAHRAKERRNLKNARSMEKNVKLALQRGKRADDYTSWERTYLAREEHDSCFAIAYNSFCYIFTEDGVCITLYPLPVWFGKKKPFDGKERIRNYKQYCRNNSIFFMQEAFC